MVSGDNPGTRFPDAAQAIRSAAAGPEPDIEAMFPIAVCFPSVIIAGANPYFPANVRSPQMATDATIALNSTVWRFRCDIGGSHSPGARA